MNNIEKELILSLLKGKEYLISDYLFLRSYEEVKKILEMKEWENPKFQGLLTPNIWKSNYEDIKKILEMNEWKELKFQRLLTSSIWVSNYENVVEKLHLPVWNNPKYESLLTPTIFAIKSSNILENIKIFEEYGIDDYITTNAIRKNPIELRKLLNYLVENNISLVIDNKLNKVINATKKDMKEKYGIDIKYIMENKIKMEK